MSGALFLLLAVIFSLLGSLLIWMRNSKPKTLENSVDSFSKEMRALAPREMPTTDTSRPRER